MAALTECANGDTGLMGQPTENLTYTAGTVKSSDMKATNRSLNPCDEAVLHQDGSAPTDSELDLN